MEGIELFNDTGCTKQKCLLVSVLQADFLIMKLELIVDTHTSPGSVPKQYYCVIRVLSKPWLGSALG